MSNTRFPNFVYGKVWNRNIISNHDCSINNYNFKDINMEEETESSSEGMASIRPRRANASTLPIRFRDGVG